MSPQVLAVAGHDLVACGVLLLGAALAIKLCDWRIRFLVNATGDPLAITFIAVAVFCIIAAAACACASVLHLITRL